MVVAGQAFLGRVDKDALHHAAKGVLGEQIVADEISRHGVKLSA